MFYGADYYPEHWPEERWETDAKLMKEANINIVRLAEFAWAKFEPKENEYDFSWLDRAIDTLYKHGIKVVMGTPTATPPKWLVDKHPDIYQKDAYKQTRGFGTRRHYCFNNPTYREYTKKIVLKIAEHYKDNEAVAAWQIDNEFGCHDTTRCYCEHCHEAFKVWLKDKYKTIDNLNKEWGTVFWSQTYGSLDEIILPWYTVCYENNENHSYNPGMLLDYYRFSSDSVVDYQKLQIDEIKKYSKAPITHNFMGHFDQIDYFNLGKDLDFVSWDNYPNNQWGKSSYQSVAMAHDLMRGVKDKNFWVMEEQSGPCGWSHMGDTPKPGQIRLWTYQAVAHGAEAIVYFRWRACTFGTEEYWYGILDHDGIPRRRYYEVQKTGVELQKLSDLIVDSDSVAEVAIVKSYDNLWSHQFQRHNSKFDYNELLYSYYKALIDNNVNMDIISCEQDFSKYKLILIPAFNLMREDLKDKIDAYVNNGGNLVITFRSGTRRWNNSMTTETLPGYFREISGIEVEEFDSLNQGRKVSIKGEFGKCTASIWCDVINPIKAEVLAVYNEEYYIDKAAVTVNPYGKGKVYYIGCDLDEEGMNNVIQYIISDTKVEKNAVKAVSGVEVVDRQKSGKRYTFVLNHNNHSVEIELNKEYTELLSDKVISGKISLKPYEVVILN